MNRSNRPLFYALWLAVSAAVIAVIILVVLSLAGAALGVKTVALAILGGAGGIAAAAGLHFLLTRTVYRTAVLNRDQAASLSRALGAAETGDLMAPWTDIELSVDGRPTRIKFSDVYGRLVGVLAESDRMSGQLNSLAHEILDQAVKLSSGAEDQSKSVADSTAAISRIDGSIHKVVGSVEELAELSENVSSATYEMIANIEEVNHNTQGLNQAVQEAVSATEEMVGNIRSVASSTQSLSETTLQTRRSMEEIESATRNIRDRAEESAAVSGSAREGAAEAKDLLSKTVASIRGLSETMKSTHEVMHQLGVHSRSIGEILTVISSVASDTHLLSLNASIMAAKAGEQGRGFTVVAQEIKTLALRTSESAKEIENLILDTQESVERAVKAMEDGKVQVAKNMVLSEQADRALAEVLERIEVAARNAHEIATATMQQAETNANVFKAVDEVTRRTDQIRAAMLEQEESSGYVRERALINQDLVDQVAKAMRDQAESSRLISGSMEKLTSSIQNIRLAAEDEGKSSAGIVHSIEAIRKMADLVAISAQNVSNTSMSVLHHSLLLRHELSGIKLPELRARITIGVLLDNVREERWQREHEFFQERIRALGANCEIRVAEGSANRQLALADELIKQGVDLIIAVAVDAEAAAAYVRKARAAGIPVIAYDRLIKNCEFDLFVSFDAIRIGRVQAEYVLQKMTGPKVLIIAGSPTDMNAHFLHQGQMEILKPRHDRREISIVEDLWVPDWDPEQAYRLTRKALEKHGPVDAVVAANDGTAGGVIRAVRELVGDRRVIVTGMDTELAACRRIVKGEQAMTVYMPIKLQASRAIEAALLILKQEAIPGITDYINNGLAKVPAILLKPTRVDAENMDEVVVKDGFHPRDAIYR
jgi:D-xylose transport system substrate-binding protein